MATKTVARRGGSLETGLRILETLASAHSLGVTEIARRIGADKANVYRLLGVLRSLGYVYQDDASKEYRPTAQLVAVAGSIIRKMDVMSIVRPLVGSLVQETGESVHVAVPTRLGAVYVAEERSKGVVSVETEIGSQAPPCCTATGKALYAFLSSEALHAVLQDPLIKHTPRTLESVAAVETDLARVRERGYALDDEEFVLGVRCLAAPVFDLHGDVVASIGISGPASRITLEHIQPLAELVKRAATEATRQLGGSSPWTEDSDLIRDQESAGVHQP